MAEWSKALVLGTSYFGSAGSNPAPVTFYHRLGGLAQSVECVVRNDEAPGSKPGFSISAPFTTQALQKPTLCSLVSALVVRMGVVVSSDPR